MGSGRASEDWAAERTSTPCEVVEAALAHTVRNPTEAAYARSNLFERRRRLMDDWAAYLSGAHGMCDEDDSRGRGGFRMYKGVHLGQARQTSRLAEN